MGKRCVLALNGEWLNDDWHRQQLNEDDFLVGVDGGAGHLNRLGFKPHLIVGDLDSLEGTLLKQLRAEGCEFAVLPREKDFTDTQVALDLVRQRGFRELLLLGAFGSRADHWLSTLFSLVPLVLAGMTFKIAPGQLVSLLALTPVTGVTTVGLKYSLLAASLDPFQPYAVSNEMLSSWAEVSWEQGVLAVYTRAFA